MEEEERQLVRGGEVENRVGGGGREAGGREGRVSSWRRGEEDGRGE